MLAKKVDVDKTTLKELLALVREGAEVLLTEGDTPVAKITPLEAPTGKRIPGLREGMWSVADDFDDPLPDEFWSGEE